MRIVFTRVGEGGSLATIHRHDGVVVELPSYSVTHKVPHDLAHAVAEREFGLADGVFGSIAAGVMFDNMRVVAGRPRHDAAARSRRLLAANKDALTLAELMAGVLHQQMEGGAETSAVAKARHDWGIVRQEPFPWPEARVTAAVDTLRERAREWRTLGEGESLEFEWPDRLVRPVSAGKTAGRRGRRG
jgi:hypothetical protein